MRLRIADGYTLSTVAAIALLAGCLPVTASAATSLEAPNSTHQRTTSWMLKTNVGARLVYVTDVASGAVTVFDRGGLKVGRIGGFNNPLGLFVDADHNLWVANSSASQILEFARGATSPTKILSDKGGLPSDVTMCPNGTLYVSNSKLSRFGGNILLYAPGSTRPTGRLTYPNVFRNYFLTCDAAGNIFSTLTLNPGGGAVVEYPGGRQAGAKQLPIKLSNFPGGIKQDHAGNLLIADQIGLSVTEYTEAGLPTGVSIHSPDSNTVPVDIDVTDHGNVLGVALFDTTGGDSEGQTYAFPTGTALRAYGSFNKPIGFAFDSGVK